jgi:hypothetical protein
MMIARSVVAAFIGLAAVSSTAALDLATMPEAEIAALQGRLADAGCYRGAVDGVAGRGTQGALDLCPLMDLMLRIETGRHTALLGSMDTSADGSLLVTGSDDKTVRLWRLLEGRLERVRMPIGVDHACRVNAVAISPDGTVVAAAG